MEDARLQKTELCRSRYKDLSRRAFSEVAAAALFLPQNNSTIFWDVVTRQLALFEGGLELQSRLWQQCVTLKRAQQQALQEHSTMLLRRTGRCWTPSQLETLSTCAAGLGLGVIRLFAL